MIVFGRSDYGNDVVCFFLFYEGRKIERNMFCVDKVVNLCLKIKGMLIFWIENWNWKELKNFI